MSHPYRRRRRDDNGHVDDWLMTYADMITLLLCFFAVILAMSIPKKDEMEQAQKKVMEQFAKPNVIAGQFPPQKVTPNVPKNNQIFDKMPSIVDNFQDNKDMQIKRGERITTINMNSAPLFARGAAEISDEGKPMLLQVLKIANSEQYHDYRITVEGHTDDAPINTPQFPSNWELSAARAAAVVRFLIGNGVVPDRLRATGFADTVPKVANRDDSGRPIPENQAQNRRVVVKLERVDQDSSDK